MTTAQLIFLSAFTLVNLAIVAAVVLVVREARRVDGGALWSKTLLRRLGRLPSERTEVNRLAFYTHRVTGIAIFAFLALHIIDVSLFAISAEPLQRRSRAVRDSDHASVRVRVAIPCSSTLSTVSG